MPYFQTTPTADPHELFIEPRLGSSLGLSPGDDDDELGRENPHRLGLKIGGLIFPIDIHEYIYIM